MPSSYSSNLLLELMADGENEGLWGDITNENLEILGRAAGGVGNITLAGTTHTLTVTQGMLSEGHYSTLVLGGSPTGTNTITISPNTVTRTFLVQNSSGQDAVFTQGSGGNVTVPNGNTAIVFCSGSGASSSVTDTTADFLRGVNNLSDLDDPDTALQNLGLTATAAEINKLDGATLDIAAVTATAAEVNVLDGSTATTGDLNKLAGVDATADEINTLDGFTGDTADLNYAAELRATGVTASEFNKLDGLTATTTELNYTDGVTSSIQTQLDAKYEAETQSEATWREGASTTEGLVSPVKIKGAVEALVPPVDDPIGVNQSWGGVSLSSGSARQNTTGRPIQAAVTIRPFNSGSPNNPIKNSSNIQVSSDGSSWVTVASTISDDRDSDRVSATMIIPSNHYYRYNGSLVNAAEMA